MKATSKAAALGIGISLVLGGAVQASERTRGAGAEGGRKVEAREVRPGVLQVRGQSGDMYVVHADGTVLGSEIIEVFGSLSRMHLELAKQGMPTETLADGTRLYADGTVAYYADLVGKDVIKTTGPITLSEKSRSMPFTEVDGPAASVVVFQDGTVLAEGYRPQPAWKVKRQTVKSEVVNGVRIYADGTVLYGEPAN